MARSARDPASRSRHHDDANRDPLDLLDLLDPLGLGFVRVAVVVPDIRIADVPHNVRSICDGLEQAAAQGCQL
ncbi:MAG: hypothetical protein ACXVA4_04450, partial [Ktedonobacterales bacterium]